VGRCPLNYAAFADQQTITDDDIQPYLDAVNPGRHIHSIGHFASEVAELLNGKDPGGDKLPWSKTHHQFRFLPGEVTLWHGINGHGKSAVTTQVAAYLGLRGKKSCLASFEMAPARTIERMFKQVAGNPNPSDSFFSQFFVKFTPRIFLYAKRGRVNRKLLIAAIRFCAAEKGISHFFVDSLMKCVDGEDDYNGQKDFVADLCDVAEETGMHIHLIHHVRKGNDETKAPSKFDAKGSGAITDQVHNVIAVWRNKAKEAAKEATTGPALVDETPDFLLICDKQRTLGWEGKWALWGDLASWHFREQSREPWMRGYELEAA
jgi:twinkle protein